MITDISTMDWRTVTEDGGDRRLIINFATVKQISRDSRWVYPVSGPGHSHKYTCLTFINDSHLWIKEEFVIVDGKLKLIG